MPTISISTVKRHTAASNGKEDGTAHVARITILGLCGLSQRNEWISTWREKHGKSLSESGKNLSPRKLQALKAPDIPEPSDIGIFVTLSGQSNIGTKYLPPLTQSEPGPVQPNAEDVEISLCKQENPAQQQYHVSWPEEEAAKRENKFVFDTIFHKTSDRDGNATTVYTPKEFRFEIGLYPRPNDDPSSRQILDSQYGIVLGNASVTLSAAESIPANIASTVDLSTTIFSQVMYLPISNAINNSPHLTEKKRHVKENHDVRELKNKLDATMENSSKRMKSRRKKNKSFVPSMSDVDAFQSKYTFQSGQGFLVIAVEVYPKDSDEEGRIDLIRKQIKKQVMASDNTESTYKMIRYLAPNQNLYQNISSQAHMLFAESFRGNSSNRSVVQKNSSDSDPMIISSMSSLVDSSDDEESSDEDDNNDTNPSAAQAFVRRLGSCSAQPVDGSSSSTPMNSSMKLIKSVTDFFTCQNLIRPDALNENDKKVIIRKPSRHEYDDQTIFSGIPYLSDQRLE